MRIFDAHIHIWDKEDKSKELLDKMSEISVCGGCLFSPPPFENGLDFALDFDERLETVLSWTKKYPDRLFPVLWIHPDEENIERKINISAQKGIMAYKIICNNFHVYEEKSIKILKQISSLNKPVFFHSGILWDGGNSSSYNRPLDWECLINIKNLRFSMGHCSWPWYDECIALYGKFLNAYRQGECSEMFFDLTPGTPEIYREDLMSKLFGVGYDVPKNIFFGTDASANDYRMEWADKWIHKDNFIYDELGINSDIKEDIYHNNLLRFLGVKPKNFTHLTPATDDGAPWYIGVTRPEDTVRTLAKKWYERLNFSKEYNEEFENALDSVQGLEISSIESYKTNDNEDVRLKNLLMYLYFCEDTEARYSQKNIPEDILLATLNDILTWSNTNHRLTNSLGICESNWLSRHLSCNIFKLGRLQFAFGKSEEDIAKIGVKKGDDIIEVHIPEGEPLLYHECLKSFELAKEFFNKYFPGYNYKCFTCHSWLLDETLKAIASKDSNILRFQDLFTNVRSDKSDAILRYTFRWDANEKNIKDFEPESGFARKIKEYLQNGGSFYESYGYREV